MIYTAKQDQTIYDIALMLYGSITEIQTILDNNQHILDEHKSLKGVEIYYDVVNNNILNFIQTNNITLTTGLGLAAENNISSFDLSFDLSFS